MRLGLFFLSRRGRTRRPHRTKRRGKNDGLQSDHRCLSADRRQDRVRRKIRHRPPSLSHYRPRHRAHVSEHPPLQLAERLRQRAHRLQHAPAARHIPCAATRGRVRPRGKRNRVQHHRTPGNLRPGRRARLFLPRAALRRPATSRDRARARHPAKASSAR